MLKNTLPSPYDLQKKLPISHGISLKMVKNQQDIQKIFTKKSNKLLLFVGPCSLHKIEDFFDYANLFKKLSYEVSKNILLVLRVFSEKSRTGNGWKGYLYDPYLDSSFDIETGLIQTRRLLLELNNMDIPCSMEFVDPLAVTYLSDLISWGFIGARTSSSQPHRQFVSSLSFPVGFKNATDGSIEPAIQGVLSSRHEQSFIGIDEHGKICKKHSLGNPYTHLVLRGSSQGSNYDKSSVASAVEMCQKHCIDPKILIDCAHGNSQKNPLKQIDVLENVLQQILEGNSYILGMMLESFLHLGNQPHSLHPVNGISITDPCLDWNTTEEVILKTNALLEENNLVHKDEKVFSFS
ncbi:MAG: 3-deoxy-7-phosphoheptulonate synthase [Chlamydiae bacterium CG10_big_fil_rev_8_21_14_0_10_35_9]|nr:MAG: 3-deoxy-7-phosphoheptulonate synthase [Chlamydiae bacterium CG10_big_fil_rev_8_21_14_0_10_35_9]